MENTMYKSDEIKKERQVRKWRQRVVAGLSCVVMLCTAYALILPAITLESDYFCGQTEHAHDDECYERELICQLQEGERHTHTSACYGTETERILVCGVHVHTEACYGVITETKLSCDQHVHDDTCYQVEKNLACGQDGHTHSEECYDENGELTCQLHVHGNECYQESRSLICGQDGHEHTAECYTTTESETLICGEEATDKTHTHSDECYQNEPILICRLETDVPHEHTDSCYKDKLVCEREEHTHTLACRSNPDADVETAADWEKTLPGLTGVWADDLLAVAESQLGYAESEANYAVAEDNETITGYYTRYGAWYGNPYGDWCAMFVSFCLNYAQIPADAVPREADAAQWVEKLAGRAQGYESFDLYREAGNYTPIPGDLAFFDTDGDGAADRVGIVTEYNAAAETVLKTIEGSCGGMVQAVAYDQNRLAERHILGYAGLTEKQEQPPVCGKEEHTHEDSCYGPEDENGEKPLICGKEEHIHDDACAIAGEEALEEISLFMDGRIALFSAADTTEQLTLYPGQVYTAAATDAAATRNENIASAVSTSNNPAKLKLGADAAFTGDTVEISTAQYTFTNVEDKTDTYQIGNGNVYLNPSAGTANIPNGSAADIVVQTADGGVYLHNKTRINGGIYLYFHRDENTYYFDRNGQTDAGCVFQLYAPAGEGGASSAEIPGYTRITSLGDISAGGSYLIAAEANGAYYVLYPSESTAPYAHVAKVAPYELSITAENVGTTTVTAGNMSYEVTVTDTISVERGKTTQIQLPAGASVESADKSIASVAVAENGLVTITGTSVGETTATIRVGEKTYTWKIQVSAPSSFKLSYNGAEITFNIVDENGDPLPAPSAADVAAKIDRRYVFGQTEDSSAQGSFAPDVEGYLYDHAIWDGNKIFSVKVVSNTNGPWRFYSTEPTTSADFYTKSGNQTVTLYYLPEGTIYYDLNLPAMTKKGTGWQEEPKIDAVTQKLDEAEKLFGQPAGSFAETGPAGIEGLYRFNIQDTDSGLCAEESTAQVVKDGYYGEERFDGWEYVDSNGATHLFAPDTPLTQKEGEIYAVDTQGHRISIPTGAVLRGKWTEVSNVVTFFVCYDGTILDVEGDVAPRDTKLFTRAVAVGHVFYGKGQSGSDNVFGQEASAAIQAMFRPEFDADNPETQIVIDCLRTCTTPSTTGVGYDTAMNTPQHGANYREVESSTLQLLKETGRTVLLSSEDGNPPIDNELCDSQHYEIRWYVLKEQKDTWHIDGVLVAKTAELAVTKTYTGLDDATISKLMEYSKAEEGNSISSFYMDVEVGKNPVHYINMTTEENGSTSTAQYEYSGQAPTTHSYHWTLHAITDEKYTLTEKNYTVDGYDCSALIVQYYTDVDGQKQIKYINGDSTSGFGFQVTGGDTTAVSFNNMYTKTDTGAFAVTKRIKGSDSNALGATLSGAVFQLTKDDDSDDSFEPETKITNVNGTAYFNNLPVGTYTLEEIKAPDGYSQRTYEDTGEPVTWGVKVTENENGKIKVEVWEKNKDGSEVSETTVCYDGGILASYSIENAPAHNTVTVRKTFTGISSTELNEIVNASQTSPAGTIVNPDVYYIELDSADSGAEAGKTEKTHINLTLDQAQRSQDGRTFTWTINDLAVGETGAPISYSVTEHNYLSASYADTIVTASVNGEKQEISIDRDANTAKFDNVTFSPSSSDIVEITNRYTNTFDLTLKKVDAETDEPLADAEFKIYGPYEQSTNTSDRIKYTDDQGNTYRYYYIETIRSDKNGIATQKNLSLSADGKGTFVYVFQESTAPGGYAVDPQMKIVQVTVGEDQEGYKDGVLTLTVPNTTYQNALITVTAQKTWVTSNGKAPAGAEVTLELYRRAEGETEAERLDKLQITLDGTADGEVDPMAVPSASEKEAWTAVWADLPAYKQSENAAFQKYTYYVREVPVGGYIVSYTGEDGEEITPVSLTVKDETVQAVPADAGLMGHLVRVTNTQTYILPDTGGSGSAGCLALGGTLMLVSCLYMFCITKRPEREPLAAGKTAPCVPIHKRQR